MITQEMLKQRMNLPLDVKVNMSKLRIKEWIKHWGLDKTYVSHSKGKDSTILGNLVEQVVKEDPFIRGKVKHVFCDTGLEYPEIKDFSPDNIVIETIRPEKLWKDILNEKGYPVLSKTISKQIGEIRRNETSRKLRLEGIRPNGERTKYVLAKKHRYLVNSPFKISEKCCDFLKKKPFKKYEKETGRIAFFTAEMAIESKNRQDEYLATGCNAFESIRPKSTPLSFWTEQDILMYSKINNIKLSPIYGDIVSDEKGILKTTGEKRTGCMFCMFGIHMEQRATGTNRFIRMKETHPKQWFYCIYTLGLGKILGYMGIPCGDDKFLLYDHSNMKGEQNLFTYVDDKGEIQLR